MDIVTADFDNTLFKRNYGLLSGTIKYLEELNYPVYIVTYRADDQQDFIASQLASTKLNIIGYAFAGSRNKDPFTKLVLIDRISAHHNIVKAFDDDRAVVVALRQQGIDAEYPYG